jgi:hypothetical protein
MPALLMETLVLSLVASQSEILNAQKDYSCISDISDK